MDNTSQKPSSPSQTNQSYMPSLLSFNPSKPFIVLLLVMLNVLVGVGGYSLGIKHGRSIARNQQTPVLPTVTQPSPALNPSNSENTISWDEAVELIRNCQVKMVAQTHSKNVTLTLKDGKIRNTIEPAIDIVIEEAQNSSAKCGFSISVLTE